MMAVYTESLVLLIFALVPVQAPVGIVQIIFLHQFHQVIPVDVLLVGAEFPQQKRNSSLETPHKQLLFHNFVHELFIRQKLPNSPQPRKTVEMSRVDQLIGDLQSIWILPKITKVGLRVDSSYKNQPMRGNLLYLVPYFFSCYFPVGLRVPITPGRECKTISPDLVPKIDADNSGIVFVMFSKRLKTEEKVFFWILFCVPESISIPGSTTPHRFASMIVQYHHQSSFGDGFYSEVQNLKSFLAEKRRVGLDMLILQYVVTVEKLQ